MDKSGFRRTKSSAFETGQDRTKVTTIDDQHLEGYICTVSKHVDHQGQRFNLQDEHIHATGIHRLLHYSGMIPSIIIIGLVVFLPLVYMHSA